MMLKISFLLVVATFCFIHDVRSQNPLQTVVEWKQLDFLFPSETDRRFALSTRKFIPEKNMPLDVDVHYSPTGSQRIFVTIPKFSEGVPVTLGTVSDVVTDKGPLIEPYPDYSWHKEDGNCDGITSVFRVMIDQCERLWVMDTGRVGGTWKCYPQLLAFDLNTDQLLVRHKIPANFVMNETIMVTPIVDVVGSCDNTKVYMADITGYAMIVYDLLKDRSWRIKNDLFSYDPKYTEFTISGESFEFTDGLTGMALKRLGPYDFIDNRQLYFHSLASNTENSVPLNVLNDEFSFTANEKAHAQYFKVIGRRSSQSAAEAIDSNGNLFFGLVDSTSIACWDSDIPYDERNFLTIAKDPDTLQFASGVKVIPNHLKDEELWVLTNRLQKFISNTMKWTEVNFRIQVGSISNILRGRKCRNFDPLNIKYPVVDRFPHPNLLGVRSFGASPNYDFGVSPYGLSPKYRVPSSYVARPSYAVSPSYGAALSYNRFGVSPNYNFLQYF